MTTTPLKIEYDEDRDKLTIDGKAFTGDFFRFFAASESNGQLFRFCDGPSAFGIFRERDDPLKRENEQLRKELNERQGA